MKKIAFTKIMLSLAVFGTISFGAINVSEASYNSNNMEGMFYMQEKQGNKLSKSVSNVSHNRNISHVKVKDEEVALGGIYPGASMFEVQEIYGKPSKTSSTDKHPLFRGTVTEWTYGKDCKLVFVEDKVAFIHVTGNNGFSTPSGIHVGSKENTVYSTYGEPSMRYGKSSIFYRSESAEDIGIKIVLSNGVVKTISVGCFD